MQLHSAINNSLRLKKIEILCNCQKMYIYNEDYDRGLQGISQLVMQFIAVLQNVVDSLMCSLF